MKNQPAKREIWFRRPRNGIGPYPVHWKGYVTSLLIVPPFAIVYFMPDLEVILKGDFPVLLLFLVVGCGCVVALIMIQLDHMDPGNHS